MLQPCNPYILGDVPHFRPGKKIFILTLHTLKQLLDWPLISILTSHPYTRCAAAPQNKNHLILIYEKTISRKISQKAPFDR